MKAKDQKFMIQQDFHQLDRCTGEQPGLDGLGGQFGTALKFDGSNQAYVEVGDFSIEGATSFAGWAYKENLGNWQRMFDFANGPGDHNLLLANRWTSNEAEWSIRLVAVLTARSLFRIFGNLINGSMWLQLWMTQG